MVRTLTMYGIRFISIHLMSSFKMLLQCSFKAVNQSLVCFCIFFFYLENYGVKPLCSPTNTCGLLKFHICHATVLDFYSPSVFNM